MQNDKFTDFDLELRSMFQNAEEEVPSRVWESLSSELDRREHRKVVALRWKRAAASVAAAAAVLSGIFIFNRNSTDLLQPVPSQVVAEVQEAVTPEPSGNPELTIEDQIAASSQLFLADIPQSVKPAAPAAKPSETVPADSFDAAPVADAEPEVIGTAQEDKATEPETTVSAPVKEKEEVWTDPFAGLEEEEESTGHKVSFTLAGNVMSNDATSSGNRAMHASPAGSVTKTGVTEKSISTYGIPLSLGVGARITLNDKWSLGTGLEWTLLSRTFTGIYAEIGANGSLAKSINSDISHELHYIGIPLNLYYNILSDKGIKFYAWGGAGLEKGVSNKYRIHSEPEDIFYKESVKGIQMSAGLGLGIEFSLNDRLGLYIDPSARYYFDCDQPSSVRTQKPYMLNFEAGLRFNL